MKYYGGKVRLAPWIISHFPSHSLYVEPFGGAAAILLQKPKVKTEVYNDVNKHIVNFFACARDLECRKALMDKARFAEKSQYFARDTELKLRQREGWEIPDVDMALAAWWAMTVGLTGSFANVRIDVNRTTSLMSPGRESELERIAYRFAGVSIYNKDYSYFLEKDWVDTTETLIYLDPPYIGDSDQTGYHDRFSESQVQELLSRLASLRRAKFCLSGFDTLVYREFAKKMGWEYITSERSRHLQGGASTKVNRDRVTEVLVMNYRPARTRSLFGGGSYD